MKHIHKFNPKNTDLDINKFADEHPIGDIILIDGVPAYIYEVDQMLEKPKVSFYGSSNIFFDVIGYDDNPKAEKDGKVDYKLDGEISTIHIFESFVLFIGLIDYEFANLYMDAHSYFYTNDSFTKPVHSDTFNQDPVYPVTTVIKGIAELKEFSEIGDIFTDSENRCRLKFDGVASMAQLLKYKTFESEIRYSHKQKKMLNLYSIV